MDVPSHSQTEYPQTINITSTDILLSPFLGAFLSSRGENRREMKHHLPYIEADWKWEESQRLAGKRLTCPDCGSNENYTPKAGTHPDGSPRRYRGCKMCGFWQEADGTEAYRCWRSTHTCSKELSPKETFTCEHCGQEISENSHPCGKYLLPDEDGYKCGTCAHFQGIETRKEFPLAGSG